MLLNCGKLTFLFWPMKSANSGWKRGKRHWSSPIIQCALDTKKAERTRAMYDHNAHLEFKTQH